MNKATFLLKMLEAFYRMAHQGTQNNYDYVRYSYDGVDRSAEIDTGKHAAYLAYFVQQHAGFHTTWSRFADDASRQLFTQLILYRLLGHLHVQIFPDLNWAQEQTLAAQVAPFHRGVSELPTSGLLGQIQHYEDLPFLGKKLSLDLWWANIAYTFLKRSYFFVRDGICIQPEAGDYVIDAGTCFGDTAVAFACAVGEQGAVYSFDPLPQHLAAAELNARQNGFSNIHLYPWAVSDTTTDLKRTISTTSPDAAPGFCIAGNEHILPMVTLDDFVRSAQQQGHAPRIDFIKMDIEGSELAALKGARHIIQTYRPKLAISLYHRNEDFVDIPAFIAKEFPFYDFYLDHYTIHAEETVLFCKPRDCSPMR